MPELPAELPTLQTGWCASRSLSWALAIGCLSSSAIAGELDPSGSNESSYVLGLSLKRAPEYEGSDRYVLHLRPLWAYKYGRFRISTSGASSVMGFATDPVGSGVSAVLLDSDRWRLGAALRFDSGRQSSDSARLTGLPDIQRTLRGRLQVSYRIDDEWSASASVSQDLLGRQGGAEFGLNLGYRHWLSDRTSVSAGVGLSMGDQQYMQTYHGIGSEHSTNSGLPSFAPGAGLKGISAGVGFMTALTPRWIAFANGGVNRLLGDAAASPLTGQSSAATATVGLAYRCCK